MKNAIKIVSILLIIAILGGCSVTGIKGASVKSQAIEYLCEKYDAKPEEFELVDYRKAQIGFEEYMYFFQKPILVDYAFEFKYNGRNFFVNREDEEFYDDYQLEDVEKWCTEWLKNNIDNKIIGFSIWSEDLFLFTQIQNITANYVFQKDDAEQILKNYSSKLIDRYVWVYFYDESFEKTDKIATKKLIENKMIDEEIIIADKCFAFYNKDINLVVDKKPTNFWQRYLEH